MGASPFVQSGVLLAGLDTAVLFSSAVIFFVLFGRCFISEAQIRTAVETVELLDGVAKQARVHGLACVSPAPHELLLEAISTDPAGLEEEAYINLFDKNLLLLSPMFLNEGSRYSHGRLL
jgi:hypothetical protein